MAMDDVVQEIRRLESAIRNDLSQVDEVGKLLSVLESHLDSFTVALAAIQSLRRILYSYGTEYSLFIEPKPDNEFISWLEPKLDFFVILLRRCLHGTDERLQIVAIDSLMDLVAVQCQSRAEHNQEFPSDTLNMVITSLIANANIGKPSRVHFVSRYLALYDDIQFWTLKAIQTAFVDIDLTLASVSLFDESDDLLHHLFENSILILVQIEIPIGNESQALTSKYFSPATKHGKAARAKSHSRALSRAWMTILCNSDLPRDLHRVILAHVRTSILPSLREPLMLCDFLTDSHKSGGIATMLSLEGLFILIAEHNLDYPGFYDDLYASLQPNIFQVKYRERFLTLIWKFMRSNYLPSYLVAAFIKKFARLAIRSSPSGALFCLAIIFNLLRRFPSSRILIDRPQSDGECNSTNGQPDPFLESEQDPKKSKALESSLWEIATLKSHFCPEVVKLASCIDSETLPVVDFDLSLYSSFTYESLLSKYRKKRRKVEMATELPKSLFPESITENWSISV